MTARAGASVPRAKLTPAYGMRPVGGFGIRGFRVHCAACGYLGPTLDQYSTVRSHAERHVCGGRP